LSKKAKYPKQVFWSDEDEGYIAIAPDLPGSSAFGETESEALQELDDAIEGWIAAAKAVGNPVPPPSNLDKQHSEKLLVRMPRSLHRELATGDDRDGVSLNQYVVFLLSKGTGSVSSILNPVQTGHSEEIFYRRAVADLWQAMTARPLHSRTLGVAARNVSLTAPGTVTSFSEVVTGADTSYWYELLGQRVETHMASLNTFTNTIYSSVGTVDLQKSSGE